MSRPVDVSPVSVRVLGLVLLKLFARSVSGLLWWLVVVSFCLPFVDGLLGC